MKSTEERKLLFEEAIKKLEEGYKIGDKINTSDFVREVSGKDIINQYWLVEASKIFRKRGWNLTQRKSDNLKRMWVYRESIWEI